ncbi:POL4 protein [Vespula squamosa]|uniref:POL4 protein n=1 Tax=Vespula squamosa TaxID=30214 RepID=A0ABD2BGH0_VESSQ
MTITEAAAKIKSQSFNEELAIPLPQASSSEIPDAFIKNLICRFGSPKGILTDQGTSFLSKLMKSIATKFRINQY